MLKSSHLLILNTVDSLVDLVDPTGWLTVTCNPIKSVDYQVDLLVDPVNQPEFGCQLLPLGGQSPNKLCIWFREAQIQISAHRKGIQTRTRVRLQQYILTNS